MRSRAPKKSAPAETRRRSTANVGERRGGDRGHHELHQHLQPLGDAGRRPAGQEGRGARPEGEAVGEDQPGAGIEGGDGLLPRGRPAALPRTAQFPPGGLRLHHLHRQQRSAARAGGRGRAEGEPGGGGGAERQPQFRRPHQSAGEGQLPGVAAAGGGLRAGRDAWISTWRTIRWARTPTASRCTCATSGLPTRRCSAPCAQSVNRGMFEHEYAHAFDGDANWQTMPVPTGDIFQWDERSTYIKKPPYFDHMVDPATSVTDLQRHARAGAAGRFGDHRPHLARRDRFPRTARRAAT